MIEVRITTTGADGEELTQWVEQQPQNGDTIRKWIGAGSLKHYIEYVYQEPQPEPISIPTIDWLRYHLTEAVEQSVRHHIALRDGSENTLALEVFISMVDARNDLQVSDLGYAQGIHLIKDMGLCDQAKADQLLALGDHKPS